MKKLLFLFAMLFCCGTMFAQSTSPRFATTTSGDNTFRNQRLTQRVIVDAAGIDTFTLNPVALSNHVHVTMTDDMVLAVNVGNAYRWDELVIVVANTTGATRVLAFSARGSIPLNFVGNSSGASISMASGRRAIIKFVFDGTKYVELTRTLL